MREEKTATLQQTDFPLKWIFVVQCVIATFEIEQRRRRQRRQWQQSSECHESNDGFQSVLLFIITFISYIVLVFFLCRYRTKLDRNKSVFFNSIWLCLHSKVDNLWPIEFYLFHNSFPALLAVYGLCCHWHVFASIFMQYRYRWEIKWTIVYCKCRHARQK